jgi:hypothetical protein
MTKKTFPRYVILAGTVGTVRFVVGVPHGRGTRDIDVDVSPELIGKIADALRCSGPQCQGAHWSIPEQSYVPHAIWHVKNPDAPMPCGSTTDDDAQAVEL